MKASVESTVEIVQVNGTQCRRWLAVSEGGVPFELFEMCIRVDPTADQTEFARDLHILPTPGIVAAPRIRS